MRLWSAALAFLLLASFAFAEVKIYVDDVGDTPQIAELKQIFPKGAEVTYFVIPTRLTLRTAELLRGESVGVHGYNHETYEFMTDYANAKTRAEVGAAILQDYGFSPACFRPPFDAISPEAEKAVSDAGLTLLIQPARDPLFNNPRPMETAALIKLKYRVTGNLRLTIHVPLDDAKLEAIKYIFK
ncbi:MAG: DUF2334 domain-containing protein [archaeon]